MARPPTIEVRAEELESLFDALEIWSKIRDGRLTTSAVPEKTRPSWAYASGSSEIVRHENSTGYHVATTHRITAPDGSVPHWDAKDLHIGDIVIWCHSLLRPMTSNQ
jgi:hypothetical protein